MEQLPVVQQNFKRASHGAIRLRDFEKKGFSFGILAKAASPRKGVNATR
jgi:hypothetical protein